MQHQYDFVAVVRQRSAQRRWHDDVGIQLPAAQSECLGRFDLAVIHVTDRPGENFRGVGTSAQSEGENGAVDCIAEECIEHGLRTHRCKAVDTGVADQ
ncbi:hypothetical protein D3C72_2249240 [compost metagenome]